MRSATKHMLVETMQWGALALGIFGFVYFFDDIRAVFGPQGHDLPSIAELAGGKQESAAVFSGEVRLKGDGRGHFIFEGAVDDRPVTFMADTGATMVALTYEDAKRAGLSPHSLDFSARVQTANGVARVAPVVLDRVRVGDITVRDVPAAVAEKGALATNLLGMSFLGRLKSFQVQNGELVLIQ
ncbi:MAG: retropepsin-like aspartic protease family protein [Methyloceanibacter sp.]|uniref:retropepsin-like aspartic protease family protein n=1 Tax=Methyloceanibacter sp. TaxID=1965321 RepID=UPI003D6CFF54